MTTSRPAEAYDAIVIGGGPGGATAATVLAMDGRRVLLLEKERFPRYHIGESLLPSTVQGICRFLGVGRQVDNAGFIRKHGATFQWGGDELWTIPFAEAIYNRSSRRVYSYQVLRSRFDEILLRNAQAKGVTVVEGHRVDDVLKRGGRLSGVRYSSRSGRSSEAHARYIVDASGQRGLLANRIGKRRYDPFFRNVAVFGYYRGGGRLSGRSRRGNVLSAAVENGWLWYIPISDSTTSVGAVFRVEDAARIRCNGPARALDRAVHASELMRDLLSTARRVRTGELGTTRVVTDYSYTNDRLWSPGGVLVGDAALFIDPLFSSGVHFATYSALLAARAINTVLRKAASESDAFDEFERRYRREFRHFYEFLVAFYELHGNEGSEFWSQRKILKPSSRRLRRDFVRRVSGLAAFTDEPATTSHVLRSFEEHTLQLRAASGVDSDALDESRLDQRTMASWQRRLETRLDARLDVWRLGNVKAARRGARAGELVPTPDGLSWRRKRG